MTGGPASANAGRPPAASGGSASERVLRTIPEPAKNAAKSAWLGYASLTSSRRLLPDFLIIGAQRAGTTSLYRYLVRHPAISRAITKELRYFDLNYQRGERWYRSRFPSAGARARARRRTGMDLVVGEATPDYVFHPHVPGRVKRLIPDVKLIVVLRDPVDRAFSHYWHQVERGYEPLSFDEAIRREDERLAGELERMLQDETYLSFPRHHHSYVTRGRYAEQLEWWLALFPREQLAFVDGRALFESTGDASRELQAFLGVPHRDLGPFPRYNAYTAGEMSPGTRAALVERFRGPNERLYELAGRDYGWAR